MDKVSIVMPAYNCEKTISRAIDSIIRQTYQYWELIIINDGSKDNTEKVCETYFYETRIKYIKIKNNGVSNARNLGIEHATGKYITFIDSDDFYEKDYLKEMIENILDSQLLCCSYNIVFDNGAKINGPILDEKNSKISLEEAINYLHKNKCLKMLWNKMFVVDIIKKNKIKMNTSFSYGEDYMFVIDYLENINKISISKLFLYNYLIHSNGLSTKYNPDSFKNRLYTLDHHSQMYERRHFNLDYVKEQYIVSFYAELVNYVMNNNKIKISDKLKKIEDCLNQKQIKRIVKEKYHCSFSGKILKLFLKYRLKLIILILVSLEAKLKSKEKFYENRRKQK